MPHVRQQIRAAAVTLLTGLATTGANVFASRVAPLDKASLPALLIYTTDEQSEIDAMGNPRPLARTVELIVEGVVAKNAALEDALDQICVEVETAMAGDVRFGALAKSSFLRATQKALRAEGDTEHGVARMTYQVLYRTPDNNPQTAI